jgi:alpha,alpha-trehalase
MAAWVISLAGQLTQLLPDHRWKAIRSVLRITDEELERWADMSGRMYVPFHGDGIISQFEDYDELKEFDWAGYREKYGDLKRLDRILEAEGDSPNRYKLAKQADVLMLFYLFSAEELQELFSRLGYAFDTQWIPKNTDYYFQRTSHGSTLSRVVHSWVRARTDRACSWHCFLEALESDVSDAQGGTTAEGIHLGAMAGTLDIVQRCYMGLQLEEQGLLLNPQLPKELRSIRTRVRLRDNWFLIEVRRDSVGVTCESGPECRTAVRVESERHELAPGDSVVFAL